MADRHLLFGLLALQMDFVTRDALIDGIEAWIENKQESLGRILVQRGHLAENLVRLLEELVDRHLEAHNNDTKKSLSSINAQATLDEPGLGDEDFSAHATLEMLKDLSHPLHPRETMSAIPEQEANEVRFRFLRPHAQGGLGRISVALDQELQREVALKELKDEHSNDRHRRSRFLMEAEVTGSLEHPGIVPVYALGSYPDGRPFYAMRFIRGDCLRDVIEQFHKQQQNGVPPDQDPLTLRQILRRFIDTCNAIAYAHSRDVIHRDIKPENVMLGLFGETLVVDWGLAKVMSQTQSHLESTVDVADQMIRATTLGSLVETADGTALGTPAYMSPEQAEGVMDRVGPASDVYSLGATLYCILTNHAPFETGTLHEVISKVRRGEFAPPSEMNLSTPAALEAICLKAMQAKTEDRYANVHDLVKDVEAWLADERVQAYPEPWTLKVGRWIRRHQSTVITLAGILVTAVLALTISTVFVTRAWQDEEKARVSQQHAMNMVEEARSRQALTLIEELRYANAQAVPAILKTLESERELVEPRLLELWKTPSEKNAPARMRVGLALLPDRGPKVQEELFEWMLKTDDPREMLVVREKLTPYQNQWKRRLWTRVENSEPNSAEHFHALVALASFDNTDPRWPDVAPEVVRHLLIANPLHLGVWSEALEPVRKHLVEPLIGVFQTSKQQNERLVAANLLVRYAGKNAEDLMTLVASADAEQYGVILPTLKEQKVKLLPHLIKATAEPEPEVKAKERDARENWASKQANVAITLLHLGAPELAWPLLRSKEHPDRRAYLLHRLAPFGTPPGLLLHQLRAEKDLRAKRALLLAIGELSSDQLTKDQKQILEHELIQLYADPDPGIHGAVDWLLRHQSEGPLPRTLAWNRRTHLEGVDERYAREAKPEIAPGKLPGWTVTKSGTTLTVIPGPVTFAMGSPTTERDRLLNEPLREVTIPHSFAVATKEVTLKSFEEFVLAMKKKGIRLNHSYDRRYSPVPEGPVLSVTWYEAAQYCRWLSEKEDIPKEMWVYPDVETIEDCKKKGIPITLLGTLEERTGYRLPTESEWEYVARAGSGASHHYGSSEALLKKYGWFRVNSEDQVWPVGQLRPNDLGMFDVLGNVSEWCHDEVKRPGSGTELYRALRGGAFAYRASSLRSALRDSDQPDHRFYTAGFRIARTCLSKKAD